LAFVVPFIPTKHPLTSSPLKTTNIFFSIINAKQFIYKNSTSKSLAKKERKEKVKEYIDKIT